MTVETIAPSLRNLLPRLWSFAFRLSGTSSLAEDLTGRTLVRLARLAEVSLHEQITPALALREMYTVWKFDLGGAYFLAREHESSSAASSLPAEHGELINAVLSLSGLKRAAVLLVHLERLSVREIASITNEPVARVVSALSEAHFNIRQCVNPKRSGNVQRENDQLTLSLAKAPARIVSA